MTLTKDHLIESIYNNTSLKKSRSAQVLDSLLGLGDVLYKLH